MPAENGSRAKKSCRGSTAENSRFSLLISLDDRLKFVVSRELTLFGNRQIRHNIPKFRSITVPTHSEFLTTPS